MKHLIAIFCLCLCALSHAFGQSLTIKIPHIEVQEDETFSLEMTTASFEEMVSIQFSVHWDPSIIAYEDSEISDLDFVAVGTTFAEEGTIRISWFDIDGIGESMENWKSFLKLNFKTLGKIGDSTPLSMAGDSLEVQIFQATDEPGIFKEIEFDAIDGSVTIVDEDPIKEMFSISSFQLEEVACAGDFSGSIALDVETNMEDLLYNWTGPNGFTSDQIDLTDLESGSYNLVVTDMDGNIVFEEVYNINQPLAEMSILEIESSAAACSSSTGTVLIDVQGGTPPYSYDIGNGILYAQSLIENLASGSYELIITDSNGCSLETVFDIDSGSSEVGLNLGDDVEACIGETVILDGGAYDEYVWSNGETGPEIEVNESAEYVLVVTDEFGCTATDSIAVNFISSIAILFEQENLIVCPNDSIELFVEGGTEYNWTDPNGSLYEIEGSRVIANPAETTTYTVSSEGECGADEVEITVEVFDIYANAGPDVCIRKGEQVQLSASGGEFYYWLGGEYELNLYDIPNPISSPLDSTVYRVMIIDENECTTFDDVRVFIAGNASEFIKAVNIITPNGDGVNDELFFEGNIEKYGINTLKIFNRWGKLIYEKIDYQLDDERFTGHYNGEELPAGTYYYTLAFREDQTIKQTLTIIKE